MTGTRIALPSLIPASKRMGRFDVIIETLLFFSILLNGCASHKPLQQPDEAIRHNNLGVALMDTGTKDPQYFPEAIKEFEAALQASPKYLTARINLGMALYYSSQTERALSSFEELAKEVPEDPNVNTMLGLLKEMKGEFQEAATHFQKVTQRDPQDPDAWYHLGYCYSKERQYQQAIEPFRKAAAIVPYQRRLRYNLYMSLSRAGQTTEAEVELENFKKLEASNVRVVEAPKSTMEYLKQGKYAEAIPESVQSQPPSRPVTQYTDVSSELGVRFKHAGTAQDDEIRKILQGEPQPRSWFADVNNQHKLIAALGSGAAFCDYNNDGRLDLFLTNVNADNALYEQKPDGKFEDVTQQTGLGGKLQAAMACAWGDYDNDGWTDLLLTGYGEIRLYHNNKGKFQDVTKSAGIARSVSSTTWCMGAAFADVDHDGDLDIYVACFLDLNKLPEKPALRFPEDFPGQPNLLFRNNSNGTFTETAKRAKAEGGLHPSRGVLFADVNDDRAIDFVLIDGLGRLTTFLNNKDGTFNSSMPLKDTPVTLPLGESRAYGDFNGDGAVDEIVLKNGVMALLNRNDSKPKNWLSVQLEGYAVPGKVKSNRLGIGTKIEVRSVGRWERKELRAGNGTMGCDAPRLYFDLGDQASVDFVRAIFPSGVRWTLKNVKSNQTVRIDEPLLDVNSCPTLFTWNGERFEFITDTLSAGILGELIAPNQYWQPDPNEWVRITDQQLQPSRQKSLELRFVNPLEEVTYLDQVRLVAVDHPATVGVYSNERMVNEPKDREPDQLYALRNLRPIAGAKDQHGHDMTQTLARTDRRYFDDFRLQPFKGFAEDWSLTLDLGLLQVKSKPVLMLQSWSYWNSSAAIVASAQANQTLWGPVLDVLGQDGHWRMEIKDLGVSAGLPRMMVVDLSPHLKPGEHVVRIRSNRTLYYDQILLADRVERLDLNSHGGGMTRIHTEGTPLLSSRLRWLGYPRRITPGGKFPEVFDYSQIDPQADWETHAGMLTLYGDVLPLLQKQDDQFVIMEHGEEVALSFDASRLPPLPPGWKRTFFFYSDGYTKGSELYSGQSETVDPLPFHSMKSYPNRQPYPADKAHILYLLDWNTRPSFMRK